MNHDDRLHRHLRSQAAVIELSPPDATSVKRRGTQRRNRRRGAIVGVAALAVAGAAVSVIDRDGDATVEQLGVASSVSSSTYEWNVVEAGQGLGASRSSAVLDGAVYRLSTAPGPHDEADTSYEPHLYRSTDGAEWAEVSLPDGVQPSSLSAGPGALYAIGTAPAGGGTRELVVATTSDGAESWSTVTLPDDVAALEARHPGEIAISQPSIAAQDSDHLVATVVVTATPDVAALLPDSVEDSAGWEVTPEGVTVLERAPSESVSETFRWEDLDIDPELRELIPGRTYLYVSEDGATFEPVEIPGDRAGWGSQVLATDDGYRLFLGGADGGQETRVLASADGRSWDDESTVPGSLQSAGLLAGRPAVSVLTMEGQEARVAHDGTWVPIDLLSAVDGDDVWVGDVAFGPLGLAAVVGTGDGEMHLVHSTDGIALATVALDGLIDARGTTWGVTVTADAIFLRVDEPSDGDPSTVPEQRVLVGTPS